MDKMFVDYNKYLKQWSRDLRNNSTRSEIVHWKFLRNRQMMGFQFNRQKPLGNFIADFYCKELQFVIEIDGSSHSGKEQYDADRDDELKKLGLKILRIEDHEVKKNIRGVLMQIENVINAFFKSPLPP